MKILYYNPWHMGHFAHMLPYYNKLGGLVYTTEQHVIDEMNHEYPAVKITKTPEDIVEFQPDIVMYADYNHLIGVPGTKSVMVFHAMEWKGYFAQKKDWNTCERLDLCLLYGEDILKEFTDNDWDINYEIIGYPRFDDVASIGFDLFANDRKTILVAPTWSNESLLKKFTQNIIDLSKDYNVIVKPHPMTYAFRDNNKEHMCKLMDAQTDTLKVFTNVDILPFMVISDMLVTDCSGCSSEFMFYDKPIVIADPGCPPVATNKNPEIWKVFKVCDNPKELTTVVKEQFEKDVMKEKRNNRFKTLVYQEDGSTATERGIRAMEKLLVEK